VAHIAAPAANAIVPIRVTREPASIVISDDDGADLTASETTPR
jgi:hypothetical protein